MSNEFLDYAEILLEDVSYKQFSSDFRINFATVRALEIIGKTTKRIPSTVRQLFLISTAVEQVVLHYAKSEQRWVHRMTLEKAKQQLIEGSFCSALHGAQKSIRGEAEQTETGTAPK